MTVNEYGQTLGAEVPNWTPRPLPTKVTLEGAFCRVIPLDFEKHAAGLVEAYELEGNDKMWTYVPVGPLHTAEDYTKAFSAMQEGKTDVHFAIVDKKTDKLVGQFGLRRIDETNGVIEVGFVFFSPLMQRSRIGTEAHYLLAKYIFEDLNYRRYEWQCHNLNVPSRNAAERLGFQFEGVFRKIFILRGANRDTAWLSMLDDEWPVCSKAFQLWLDDGNFNEDGSQIRRLQDIRSSLLN